MKRFSNSSLAAVLLVLASTLLIVPLDEAQAQEKRFCWRLDKIEYEPSDAKITTMDNDGNIVSTTKDTGQFNYPNAVWKISSKQGRASHTQPKWGDREPGSLEVTWAVPPNVICSDRDFKVSFSVTATGNIVGGASFSTKPNEMLQGGREKSVVGSDPIWTGKVRAAGFPLKDFNPNASGSALARPRATDFNQGNLILSVDLIDGGYGFSVFYRYKQIKEGEPLPPEQPQPPIEGMILQVNEYKVRPGQEVLVPIYLIRPTNVKNMNWTLAYDSAVAILVEPKAVQGNLPLTLFEANPREDRLVRMGFAQTDPLNDSGTVAVLRFKAVGEPGAKTPLTLAVSEVNNPERAPLPIKLIHGYIEIVKDIVDLPRGSCYGRTQLGIEDARCALQMSVGNRDVSLQMDMNNDGQVTSQDAAIILQQVLNQTRLGS